jgi:hypothetical protein
MSCQYVDLDHKHIARGAVQLRVRVSKHQTLEIDSRRSYLIDKSGARTDFAYIKVCLDADLFETVSAYVGKP